MSKERKTLKIVSLVLLAWGIIQVVMAIVRIVGGLDSVTSKTMLGTYAVCALASFFTGWAGIQGSNKPSASPVVVRNSAIVIALIVIALVLWGLFLARDLTPFVNAAVVSFAAITFVALVASHVFARKVRAQAER
ncbi:MAG: hypothetical protein IJ125_02025 [Atopobiaceae bacterium]|nr:hypothetical protein [Atopobiaceae bacterium]